MNALFHRAKHWQLFIILIGGVIIFELLIMTNVAGEFNRSASLMRPPNMSSFFWFFIPMMLFVLGIIFGWQWSIGWGLKDKLPRGVRMNFKRFKAFMLFPLIYLICYMIFILWMFQRLEAASQSSNPFDGLQLIFPVMLGMIIIIPLHLFAMFCMFYNIYFCAKLLKSIELGREAELNDYIGYFFLFWFNFVGFWIIQPSVNRITSPDWTPPPTPPGYEALIVPDPTFDPVPEKEVVPRGDLLKTKDHKAFEHDDDFDGLF